MKNQMQNQKLVIIALTSVSVISLVLFAALQLTKSPGGEAMMALASAAIGGLVGYLAPRTNPESGQ